MNLENMRIPAASLNSSIRPSSDRAWLSSEVTTQQQQRRWAVEDCGMTVRTARDPAALFDPRRPHKDCHKKLLHTKSGSYKQTWARVTTSAMDAWMRNQWNRNLKTAKQQTSLFVCLALQDYTHGINIRAFWGFVSKQTKIHVRNNSYQKKNTLKYFR